MTDQVLPSFFVRSARIRGKLWIVLLAASTALANYAATQGVFALRGSVPVPIVRGTDIRFQKLPNPQNLSQVRVGSIVQDGQGFLWFGTWNGLNRYDGYKLKVFKHEAGNKASLSGTHVYSLFRDRAGDLWVGTDQFLDRFDPLTETFQHYRLDQQCADPNSTSIVTHISQDSHGFLWLSTRNGLFRLDHETGNMKNYCHASGDSNSLGDNDVKSTGEDRSGSFWVGTSRTLDEFDRETGRVRRRFPMAESGIGLWFHEDKAGVFWIIYGSSGRIATLDRNTGKLTTFEYEWTTGAARPNQAYAMLEDQDGTMWFGTAGAGLMRFDRAGNRFVSYEHDRSDGDSIGHNRVIAMFEDREANIWIGLHQAEPNFFRKKPLPFENLARRSGCKDEISGLVSSIHYDSKGYLWLAANRRLQRINRKTGECFTVKEVEDSEVLSIAQDGPGVLWLGNASPGLLRYDLRTGKRLGYSHNSADPTTLCSGVIDHLLVDRTGTLWSATWDGLCGFDASTGRFTRYKPDPNTRGLNYYSIAQNPDGAIWLGGNLGLHRFDPSTHAFKTWSHNPDDPASISDNRVNAVFVDRLERLWIGTQNGLDSLEPTTGKITRYNQGSDMAGNAVSCILEDARGTLWMSTNKGISSFRPETKQFANYTVADGLPGPDLTGWGSCYKSPAEEMFFAGFSGATAFFPEKVEQDDLAEPRTVLTDFRLFGNSVAPGAGTPLQAAINHTRAIRLSQEQNIFSIEFSALTYFNPGTVRYRYRLDGLDHTWHEVGSDERLASYTTLPAGSYSFHVQAATSRGPWSPDLTLAIDVLPPFWETWWFVSVTALLMISGIWMFYQARLRRLAEEFQVRLEERVGERTRIAQELHDTLLQNITGLSLQISGLAKRVPGPESLKANLIDLRQQAEDCLREARQSVWDIRSPDSESIDLGSEIAASGTQLTTGRSAQFSFHVEGRPCEVPSNTRQQLLRIAREAIANSAQHAEASRIEVRLAYKSHTVMLRIRDDGQGFNTTEAERLSGHFGLATMRERAARIGASLTIVSNADHGTMIEVVAPLTVESD